MNALWQTSRRNRKDETGMKLIVRYGKPFVGIVLLCLVLLLSLIHI